jgi:hypothetical protein
MHNRKKKKEKIHEKRERDIKKIKKKARGNWQRGAEVLPGQFSF